MNTNGKWKCPCDIGLWLFHPSNSALWCSFYGSAVRSAALRSVMTAHFLLSSFNVFAE